MFISLFITTSRYTRTEVPIVPYEGDIVRMHQLGVYMKLLGSDFSNGVNFAIAKSMVRLEDMLGETTSCSSPDYEM